MAIFATLSAERIVSVRLEGMQSANEFGAFSAVLTQRYSEHEALHVLCDWTALVGWDNAAEFARSCRCWSQATKLIRRAAIVHDHRWNPQAAVLAAVLRVDRVEVRSWLARDLARARDWLA